MSRDTCPQFYGIIVQNGWIFLNDLNNPCLGPKLKCALTPFHDGPTKMATEIKPETATKTIVDEIAKDILLGFRFDVLNDFVGMLQFYDGGILFDEFAFVPDRNAIDAFVF